MNDSCKISSLIILSTTKVFIIICRNMMYSLYTFCEWLPQNILIDFNLYQDVILPSRNLIYQLGTSCGCFLQYPPSIFSFYHHVIFRMQKCDVLSRPIFVNVSCKILTMTMTMKVILLPWITWIISHVIYRQDWLTENRTDILYASTYHHMTRGTKT